MVTHMKTTIDIADDLLLRAKEVAKERNITLRSLIERGLTEILEEKSEVTSIDLPTFEGKLNPEFEGKSWDEIRDVIYE